MSKNTPKPTPMPPVKPPRGKRKVALVGLPRTEKVCQHEELRKRINIPVNQYVCGDCKGKFILVSQGPYALMPPEEFGRYKRAQEEMVKAAKRRESTGLVTPDEARREGKGR